MDSIAQLLPANWRILYHILFFPVAWLLWTVNGSDGPFLLTLFKITFLTLPVLFICVGVFCTVVSLITIIFRPNRTYFIATMMVTWWDGGKAILTFWAGIIKFIFLSIGWLGGGIRLVLMGLFQTLKDIVFLPLNIAMNSLKGYSRPGIPWVAVIITFFWIILEALVFSYILTPLIIDIIAGLTNNLIPHPLAMTGLFIFLFMLIGGSFACMHGLVEAIGEKNVLNIIKMLFIELIVMLVEVFFFYREFVDSLAPWLAQMTNDSVQLGAGPVIGIAMIAWFGVRAGTWFFFAKYGTPTLLSIISREGISSSEEKQAKIPIIGLPLSWIRELTEQIQKDMDWFTIKSKEILTAFILPPIQVLAVMTNFGMILLTGKNLFNLPIKSLEELKDTKYMLDQISDIKEKRHD